MKNIKNYTEHVLFDNYMVSSCDEEYIHSQIPFYIEKDIFDKFIYYGELINKLSLRILHSINDSHKELFNYFEDFQFKDKIFQLKCPLSPMYWTRYDTFIEEHNGNIKFSEFNYDKPCGQKEIDLGGQLNFKGNVNKGFCDKLKRGLLSIAKDFCKDESKVNVGFLMDPCHYEEFHHSNYFKHIFKDTNINIIQVGPNNLSVTENEVYAYSKVKLKIILRLFPTEFFYEVNNIEEILDVFDKGNVVIINDPRVIAIQAKGFFAYLWDLVKNNSRLISNEEKEAIKECIPYTELFHEEKVQDIIKNKNEIVIKSSLGRYSQEVYIGVNYSEKEWKEQIEKVLKSDKIHIIQKLIHMRLDYTYAPDINGMNIPNLVYGNFGTYIMKDHVAGFLVRWGKSLLTDDYDTWMNPIGTDDFPIKLEKFRIKDRNETYENLSEKLAFQYGFTGEYTNINESISLDVLSINKTLFEEIIYAGEKFCSILNKIYKKIQSSMDIFGPVLGIPSELYKIVENTTVNQLCALGRIDFCVDNSGDLKILEFNSETPAGLVEALGIAPLISKEYSLSYKNPNEHLREKITDVLKNIINDIEKKKRVYNIAVVTCWYYEDIYNTGVISDILKELGTYNIIFGNVYDLKSENNDIYLYGQKIDAIYRYYPLDWFYYEEEMRNLIEPLSKGDYLINPGHTIITQSKVISALLYELIGKGVISHEDEEFILKYIPYTTMEKDSTLSPDYLIKPYLGREGQNIRLNYEKRAESKDIECEREEIYQNRVNIRPFKEKAYSTTGCEEKFMFPIIGAYITGDKFAGIYSRMGNIITDKNAVYITTCICN